MGKIVYAAFALLGLCLALIGFSEIRTEGNNTSGFLYLIMGILWFLLGVGKFKERRTR